MMKNPISRRYILGALLALASLPAAADWSDGWFKGKAVEGSGNIQKQDRTVTGFSGIDLALPARLELRQGDKEGVQVETDDNLQSLVETVVESGYLKIRNADKNTYPKTRTMNIVVYCKNLEKIAVSGSGKVWTDKLASKELQTKIGGSGDVQIKALQADSLSVVIGGSGNFVAAGNVNDVAGTIGGSGDIKLGKLEARNVKIKIGGSGTAQVWARDKLDVSIGGSGDVSYYGDPKISKSIGGSGKVTRKGDVPG
ncbi:DUF2807 domain-containing protein [Undibacterium sp. YM2]|nr:DUF2807 domain-containing protein [Undibacterium sp. YM2]